MKRLLALTCTALLALPTPGQTVQRQAQVYRCGPEGRDLRDSPCPGAPGASGQAPVAYDTPSAADRQAAHERHRADVQRATALAARRRADEADVRHPQALRLGPSPAAPAEPASAPTPHAAKPPKLARPHKPARPSPPASGPTQPSR